ncbi:TetR/AcrR family transcriptional regulator [Luteimicrobium xylanilyticum]|uniref:Putative HTH-type transcriptional regulator YdeS n=1 Tax=Luteimicrobium xylanilyticum TaxID=1133546 RepID=A0A5P9Q5D8_9MICO|nr:TetR/AcrR family transcriptional regulator [Luteimicrobium xylanilyticum]QFU96574.1 putative HTH-type transcriptional regulator YdeS [Luteimicrobium xylanilyticum]
MNDEHARTSPGGRPRSEEARTAVLHAVDDLLLEVGYAAMTMKNVAERAGVSRQTVYRWWSTKAEILLEATADDAREELTVPHRDDPVDDVAAYLEALERFLAESGTGAGYRALVGEAQHDAAVAELLRTHDILGDSARVVVARSLGDLLGDTSPDDAAARLVGPTFYRVLTGRAGGHPHAEAESFVRDLRARRADA